MDSAEEARLPAHPAHGVGIVIVHLADQGAPSPGAALGGREGPPLPCALGFGGGLEIHEEQVPKLEGPGQPLRE